MASRYVVEHLNHLGILAEVCLGRTVDWLYDHDVTRLFAGLELRARRAFGIAVGRLHADTTAFSVHGQYALDLPEGLETPERLKAAAQSGTAGADASSEDGEDAGAPTVIEGTYGESRDHREELERWRRGLGWARDRARAVRQPVPG